MVVTQTTICGDPSLPVETRASPPGRQTAGRRNARSTPCSRALWRPVGTVYASASRRRCWLHPFGLCANLRFCDESADSQALPPIAAETRVNQLRNIALERPRWCRKIPTERSMPLDSGACPTHPQTFPQARGVSGSGFAPRVGTGLCPVQAGHNRLSRPTRRVRCCLRSGSQSAWNCA